MRYFKFRWPEEQSSEQGSWGASWWYYEFGPDGSTLRQAMLFDNGYRLRYGPEHLRDDYGELLWDVKLAEFDLSQGEEIGQAEFEQVWQSGSWTNESISH